MDDDVQMSSRIKNRGAKAAIALSAAASFMLCVFEPLNLYFQNRREYWYDFYTLMPVCLLMFIIFFATGALALMLLAAFVPRLYSAALTLYTALFVCLYIQGNYMAEDLPVLDGLQIDWSDYSEQSLYSIIMWTVVTIVIVAARLLLKKNNFETGVSVLSCFIMLMLLVTVVTVGIMNDGFVKRPELTATTDYEWLYSTDANYIIVVLDAVDGEEEIDVLDSHPEYKDALADFTFYDNVMCGYPYTFFAMPFLLSGEWYEYQEDYYEYKEEAYANAPIISALREEGYRLGMYDVEVPVTDERMSQYENLVEDRGSISSVVDFAKVQLRLVGFKYLPYSLKRVSQVLPWELDNLEENREDVERVTFYGNNIPFYEHCISGEIEYTEDKCFKLIHLEGAHVPLVYNADVTTSEVTSYTGNVEATNTVMAAYIEKLKESGVYDNSVIIFLSDHGFNRNVGDVPEERQHSILFVKGIGETHGEMQVDSAPISQEDFSDAYLKLLDGGSGAELFEWEEGDARERRYLFHYSEDELTLGLWEYMQSGWAGDEDTLEYTGNYILP